MHRPNTKSFRTKSMPCGASRSIAPTRLGNDAPAGNPLDQSAAGRKRIEPQAQCDRCPRARALRGKAQAQWVRSQSSFLSAKDPRLHFGLGTAAKVSVELHWPLADLKIS